MQTGIPIHTINRITINVWNAISPMLLKSACDIYNETNKYPKYINPTDIIKNMADNILLEILCFIACLAGP